MLFENLQSNNSIATEAEQPFHQGYLGKYFGDLTEKAVASLPISACLQKYVNTFLLHCASRTPAEFSVSTKPDHRKNATDG